MSIFKKKLTVNEAINKAHTSENAMLIDCRTKDEFNHGHVAGAVNIPLDKITEDRILRRFPDKETSLYIIGSYNFRPEKAVKAFKKLGRYQPAGRLRQRQPRRQCSCAIK